MTKIQLRRDTAANWSTNNPTPSAGEPCFETDTGKFKIGDGVTKYTNLPYQGGGGLEVCDIGMALYVDETKGLRRYLNGQIVDINTNTQAFLNRLKDITTLHPSLLCTEEEWQTAKTMSAFGQVGKFVFNYSGDEIVSVRLPRVVNVQGLFDLQNLGMTVAESLPNITGGFTVWDDVNMPLPTGCFEESNHGFYSTFANGSNAGWTSFNMNASRSSSTYKDGAPVQQEAIQYPYFIQIATGSETENNIINDIKLNNPYSLFDSKYSDHELNNLSWLLANGTFNGSNTVHPSAYQALLVENNAEVAIGSTVTLPNGAKYTKQGLSVKLSTETYTDYDFVLNTADETFRLPLLDGSEDLLSDRHDDLKLLVSGSKYIAPANGWFWLSKRASAANQYINIGNDISGYVQNYSSGSDDSMNLIRQARKGEAIFSYYNTNGSTNNFRFIYAQGNGSLYFYVGETVQNANLIDAGRIGELVATKTDMLQASGAGMPSNKYIDLELGSSGASYTAPANGQIILYGASNNEQNTNHSLTVTVNTNKTYCNSIFGSKMVLGLYFPVSKGDVFKLEYIRYVNNLFRFIYANGSEPST